MARSSASTCIVRNFNMTKGSRAADPHLLQQHRARAGQPHQRAGEQHQRREQCQRAASATLTSRHRLRASVRDLPRCGASADISSDKGMVAAPSPAPVATCPGRINDPGEVGVRFRQESAMVPATVDLRIGDMRKHRQRQDLTGCRSEPAAPIPPRKGRAAAGGRAADSGCRSRSSQPTPPAIGRGPGTDDLEMMGALGVRRDCTMRTGSSASAPHR